jgi:penicillin-binding protein 2
VFAVGAFFLVGILVLAANLYRLMVVRHDEFLSLSVANQFKDVRVPAPRGQIKDRRGEILVDVRPSFDVSITPAFCLRCSTDVLPVLAEVLQWDEAQRTRVEGLLKAAHGPQRYQPMAVGVDLTRKEYDTLAARQYQLPGVDLPAVPHRHYRAGAALAHVLGYMNEISQEELSKGAGTTERSAYALGDYIGRRGVERT